MFCLSTSAPVLEALRRASLYFGCGVLGMLGACTITDEPFSPLPIDAQSLRETELTDGAAGTASEGEQAPTTGRETEQGTRPDGLIPTEPGPLCEGEACSPSASTCSDGRLGPGEADVDCGGTCQTLCLAGARCGSGEDCDSAVCSQGECLAAQCDDGVVNGGESDVDCGGACPQPCSDDQRCEGDADCASGVCEEQVCRNASCGDGVLNGEESDRDCGGSQCGSCAAPAACVLPSDCASEVCAAESCPAGVASCCQEPTCEDGIRNGDEAGVDCGGLSCSGCELGTECTVDGDCASDYCSPEGLCAVAPTCNDGLQNGDEQGVDCGGSQAGCPICCDLSSALDMGPRGTPIRVNDDSCLAITQFPGYSPTHLQSMEVGAFPVPVGYLQACTGQSGGGSFPAIFTDVQMPGVSDGCGIVVQLFGTGAPMELRWY